MISEVQQQKFTRQKETEKQMLKSDNRSIKAKNCYVREGHLGKLKAAFDVTPVHHIIQQLLI